MARVVIGLSGGVDSSVAAWLLKQQGHEVVGLFMINWHDTTGTLEGDCPWHDDRVFAELVARRLDIPLHVVDLSDHYRSRVVDYMFAEYARGRTPNPDVLCNREIKFDVFLREALRLGADYVATGHYCRKEERRMPDGSVVYRLLAGSDPNKDQSYFLCQLSQEQLRYAMFPVGELLKPEVRRIAQEQHLATAKRKVFGLVDIDMIAGPSEILVLADSSANPQTVAADLLSQAEHDRAAAAVLVTDSEALANAVQAALEEQLPKLKREEIARASIDGNGKIILTQTMEQAVDIANEIAPEHLEIVTQAPRELLPKIKNAGAVFLGSYTPEPLGDYLAGPDHVLPTSGTARFFSPLSVDSFLKSMSVLEFSREALEPISGEIIALAQAEKLTAHANSIQVRLE